jgi:hypothetical protein
MPTGTSVDGRLTYLTRVCCEGPTRRQFLVAFGGMAGLTLSEVAAKRHSGKKRQGPAAGRLGTESRSRAVTIVLNRERDAEGNTLSATFSATGAIKDAGTFAVEGVHDRALRLTRRGNEGRTRLHAASRRGTFPTKRAG